MSDYIFYACPESLPLSRICACDVCKPCTRFWKLRYTPWAVSSSNSMSANTHKFTLLSLTFDMMIANESDIYSKKTWWHKVKLRWVEITLNIKIVLYWFRAILTTTDVLINNSLELHLWALKSHRQLALLLKTTQPNWIWDSMSIYRGSVVRGNFVFSPLNK